MVLARLHVPLLSHLYGRNQETDGIRSNYDALQSAEAEVIQVAPNLLESARRYFGRSPLPFPFVCDPDKRLFAVYGLGDRGVLEATRTAVVSFAHAFTHGDSVNQTRGAFFDVMNRNFVRRLHHLLRRNAIGLRIDRVQTIVIIFPNFHKRLLQQTGNDQDSSTLIF